MCSKGTVPKMGHNILSGGVDTPSELRSRRTYTLAACSTVAVAAAENSSPFCLFFGVNFDNTVGYR